MREIRLYGSEGGGAVRSPYPYQASVTGRDASTSPAGYTRGRFGETGSATD